jgi:hypothetical protein
MSIDSYKSVLDNLNLDFENRSIYFINKPLSKQLVYNVLK